MTDISELERRITAALDRIGQGVEQLDAGSPAAAAVDEGEVAALREALEDERLANAQLEERVRAIKEKQETMVARLEQDVASLKDALKSRDADLQQLRSVNEELRGSNASLREANAQGVGDADLVNSAMVTELESLRAARAADRSEIEEILATLEPVLKEA